ncbi:MAG: DUF433 domain-containing protein [Dehalococcoidia bacterium]
MRTKRTEYKHVLLWPDGTPTVSGTRLKVKHVAAEYDHGRTPEEIQESYPSHALAEIYSALAFYFDHKEEMDRNMEEDAREEERLWAEIQNRQGPSPTREELVERHHARDRVR